MLFNPKVFANALTSVIAAIYIICFVLSFIAPDFVTGLGQSWVHVINLRLIKDTSAVNAADGIIGLVSLSLTTWVVGFSFAWLYNYWSFLSKRKV